MRDKGVTLSIDALIGITLAVAIGVFVGLCAFALWGPETVHLID